MCVPVDEDVTKSEKQMKTDERCLKRCIHVISRCNPYTCASNSKFRQSSNFFHTSIVSIEQTELVIDFIELFECSSRSQVVPPSYNIHFRYQQKFFKHLLTSYKRIFLLKI